MINKEKLKEIWNQISIKIQNVFLKYPCTMSAIIFLTLLGMIYINRSSGFVPEYLMPFLGYLGAGFYFCESGFQKKLPLKAAGILASVSISILVVYFYNDYYKKDYYIPNDIWFERIRIAYIIVCLVLGIYYCYRRSGQLLPQYGIRVFSNLIKTHIIFNILGAGALMIGVIIQELFFSNSYDLNIMGRMMILVIGFFYAPSCIYSFAETNSRTDTFSKILVKYVLFPLTILVFAIIYFYVLKILILRDIPSNQIFAILTGVFILSMPTWTMMEALEEENIWYRISRKLPLLFIPFILLQMYSVGVRIEQYGITPERYMGVMWILLEIIYLFIYFKIHRFAGRMLVVIAIGVIAALLIPGVNMYSVSILSQERILSQYKKNTELSEEEEKEIYGAYEYLQGVQNSEKYIDNKYTLEEITEIKGFYSGQDDRYYSSKINISIDSYISNLDIKEYSQMQVVQYDRSYGDPSPNLKKLKLTRKYSEDEVITVNLEDIIKQYVDYGLKQTDEDGYYINIDSYYMKNHQINLDEDRVLFIMYFEIEYDKETEKVEDLELTAYLFQ